MFKYEEYRNHTETDLKKHYAYEFFFSQFVFIGCGREMISILMWNKVKYLFNCYFLSL